MGQIKINHMKVTAEHNERMAKMTFASIYPHYRSKVEKKGRTIQELHQVIEWLTGFNEDKLEENAYLEEEIDDAQDQLDNNIDKQEFLFVPLLYYNMSLGRHLKYLELHATLLHSFIGQRKPYLLRRL